MYFCHFFRIEGKFLIGRIHLIIKNSFCLARSLFRYNLLLYHFLLIKIALFKEYYLILYFNFYSNLLFLTIIWHSSLTIEHIQMEYYFSLIKKHFQQIKSSFIQIILRPRLQFLPLGEF